jgi:hypothetical protein
VIVSCAIITTEANAQIRPIHERMPVILSEENLSAWLDPGTQSTNFARPAHTICRTDDDPPGEQQGEQPPPQRAGLCGPGFLQRDNRERLTARQDQ